MEIRQRNHHLAGMAVAVQRIEKALEVDLGIHPLVFVGAGGAIPVENCLGGIGAAHIVFAIMFGLAARVVLDTAADERTRTVITQMLNVIEAMQKTVFKMIDWIMAYFPFGIFALTACNFAVYGVELFKSYFQVA